MNRKFLIILIILILLLGGAVGYTISRGITPEEAESISESRNAENLPSASVISDEEAAKITASIMLKQDASESGSDQVRIDGNTIYITQPGTYHLSGELKEGQILVNVNLKDPVVLVLDNVSVTNSSAAALLAENTHDLSVYLAEGSSNTFTSGAETAISLDSSDDSASGGAVTFKDDATICGPGSLTVNGYINNGIHCSNRLFIESGTISVTAVNNGIKGKDSLTVDGGELTILSGNDGLKSDDTTGAGYGVVVLNDGTISITSYQDAVQAETMLIVNGGTLELKTYGDLSGNTETGMQKLPGLYAKAPLIKTLSSQESASQEGTAPADNNETEIPAAGQQDLPGASLGRMDGRGNNGWGGKGGNGGMMPGNGNSAKSSVSAKGLKAGTSLIINGGLISIDAADDALHSDGSLMIKDGNVTLSSKDDGIHAETDLTIENGTIDILAAYEGIEGKQITVNGGKVSMTTSDDGFNASGDSSQPNLIINNGTITVNASGDGLDSNGNLIINGGLIIVDGPSQSANGALDSGTESGGVLQVNGGTLLAIGAAGMAETPDSGSSQLAFASNTAYSAGDLITVKAADGTELISYTALKSGGSIIFSSPAFSLNDTVTLTVAGTETQITLTETVTGGQGGMNPGGMGPGGMNPGRKDQNGTRPGREGRPDGESVPEGMTPPDGESRPEGMEPPEGMTPPEGESRPEGMEPPEGMTPPDGESRPEGMEPPDGMEPPEGGRPGEGQIPGGFPGGQRPGGEFPGSGENQTPGGEFPGSGETPGQGSSENNGNIQNPSQNNGDDSL